VLQLLLKPTILFLFDLPLAGAQFRLLNTGTLPQLQQVLLFLHVVLVLVALELELTNLLFMLIEQSPLSLAKVFTLPAVGLF
jgi:hypothetical protein